MRKVMIGTPCHDGKVNCRWANSYGDTVRMAEATGMQVHALFIPGNADLAEARNEIVANFLATDFDDLVFIDSDISWQAEDFFKLLSHPVATVGATYPHKKGALQFVVKTIGGIVPTMDDNGLMRVIGLGMGFFKLSRTSVEYLSAGSQKYKISGHDRSAVFEFGIIDGQRTGEDISMCLKLPAVYLDPAIVLEHSGDRQHFGNPLEWFAAVQAEVAK